MMKSINLLALLFPLTLFFSQEKFTKFSFTTCEVHTRDRASGKSTVNNYEISGTVLISKTENYYLVNFKTTSEIFNLKLYYIKTLKDIKGNKIRMDRRVDDDGKFYNTNNDLLDDDTVFNLTPIDNTISYSQTYLLKK